MREFLADLYAESPDEFRRVVNFFLMRTGSDPLPVNANLAIRGGITRPEIDGALAVANGK